MKDPYEIIRHPLEDSILMTDLHLLMRWNPFKNSFQYWCWIGYWKHYMVGTINTNITKGILRIKEVSYQDTWAEPEESL